MQRKVATTFSISFETIRRFDNLSAATQGKLNRSQLAEEGFNLVMDRIESDLKKKEDQDDHNPSHS